LAVAVAEAETVTETGAVGRVHVEIRGQEGIFFVFVVKREMLS